MIDVSGSLWPLALEVMPSTGKILVVTAVGVASPKRNLGGLERRLWGKLDSNTGITRRSGRRGIAEGSLLNRQGQRGSGLVRQRISFNVDEYLV